MSSPVFSIRKKTKQHASNAEYADITIDINNEAQLGCRLYIADKASPILFYFHGNGETINDYDDIARSYIASGVNLLLLTYRGYGWSTGSPTVSTFFSDSHQCIKSSEQWLISNGYTGMRFVMGRSIGSAAAIDVALHHPDIIKGLIIESGFSKTLPLLENLGCDCLDSLTEEEGFDNCKKISSISMPTLILHGAKDQIIPVSQAESLQASCGARSKKFFIIPGADHNTMIGIGGEHYFTTISSFINEITGETSWRNRRRQFKKQSSS